MMSRRKNPDVVVVFQTALGWSALIGSGRVLKQLTFGHSSRQAALRSLDPQLVENAAEGTWNEPLVRRLQSYASAAPADFREVPIDPGPLTPFRRRVIDCCRQIPYGHTLSYGELAAEAGSPHAARAVGNCMAANRIPLVIPCHRVIAADGRPGPFSAPRGTEMKKRLLALEAGGL
jgi:methylated-DNA-[protein]-cysteine S-methyltransferase